MIASHARESIVARVYSLALAQDHLDYDLLVSLFLPDQTFRLDLSGHMATYPPVDLLPSELCDMVHFALSGFTGTQHLLGNPILTYDETRPDIAHLQVYCRAYHCLQQGPQVESVTMHGTWDVDLAEHEGQWFIRKIVGGRLVPLDNPRLYETAKSRVEQGFCRKPRTSAAELEF
jgi:hypothetical protein